MAKHDKSPVGISTILNPVPVVMVSCAGKDISDPAQRPNIMTAAWAGTVNSEPPMLSVSIRKSRHSHKLISETGEFVVNLVSKSLCKPCDYCGVRSGADEDKFAKCGLTPVKAEGLEYAYAVKESPVSISCKVKSVTDSTTQSSLHTTTANTSFWATSSGSSVIPWHLKKFLRKGWAKNEVQRNQQGVFGKVHSFLQG